MSIDGCYTGCTIIKYAPNELVLLIDGTQKLASALNETDEIKL